MLMRIWAVSSIGLVNSNLDRIAPAAFYGERTSRFETIQSGRIEFFGPEIRGIADSRSPPALPLPTGDRSNSNCLAARWPGRSETGRRARQLRGQPDRARYGG